MKRGRNSPAMAKQDQSLVRTVRVAMKVGLDQRNENGVLSKRKKIGGSWPICEVELCNISGQIW